MVCYCFVCVAVIRGTTEVLINDEGFVQRPHRFDVELMRIAISAQS